MIVVNNSLIVKTSDAYMRRMSPQTIIHSVKKSKGVRV